MGTYRTDSEEKELQKRINTIERRVESLISGLQSRVSSLENAEMEAAPFPELVMRNFTIVAIEKTIPEDVKLVSLMDAKGTLVRIGVRGIELAYLRDGIERGEKG